MGQDFESDVAHPRALLAPCMLLLLAEAPGHGYELMERLRPLGFDWGGPGPIYRELRALEAAELVASAWSAPRAGPVPRVYELTDAGREALDRCAANAVDLTGLLNQFMGRHKALGPSGPQSGRPGPSGPQSGTPGLSGPQSGRTAPAARLGR